MAVIDDRGRLFGRVGLIEASLVAAVALIAALAIETYRLYRPPPVAITSVEPCCLLPGRVGRGRVHGRGFRPYHMARIEAPVTRAWRIDDARLPMTVTRPGLYTADPAASAFSAPLLVESPTVAEVQIPPLVPGAYDLVLYDDSGEVARLPRAFAVEAPATPIVVRGVFTGLTDSQARVLSQGTMLKRGTTSWWGSVTILGSPQQRDHDWAVPASLKLYCVAEGDRCRFGEILIIAGARLSLDLPDGWTSLEYEVEDIPDSGLEKGVASR